MADDTVPVAGSQVLRGHVGHVDRGKPCEPHSFRYGVGVVSPEKT